VKHVAPEVPLISNPYIPECLSPHSERRKGRVVTQQLCWVKC